MKDEILHDHHLDNIDRRGFLKCMAWVGTGVLYSAGGGILRSQTMDNHGEGSMKSAEGDFHFVQISDSHIGFKKEPNQDVTGTLQEAVTRIYALPVRPDF